jgi:hypothetical protein
MIAVEPVERFCERTAGHVHAVEPPVALAHDQARVFEHAHVPRDGGRRHAERLGQLADRGRAHGQAFEHVAPCGMGERREHGIKWAGLIVNHIVNYKCEPARAQGETSDGRLPSQ